MNENDLPPEPPDHSSWKPPHEEASTPIVPTPGSTPPPSSTPPPPPLAPLPPVSEGLSLAKDDDQPTSPTTYPAAQEASLSPAGERILAIREAVKRVFIGQEELVEHVLLSLLCGGHVLIEGNPGLGKTHLVLALSRCFGGAFGRVQFTPDLMPADVTGHTIYDMGSREFHLKKGPVFCNLLLADEINRAPAKTQSALLEVMQERQVTIDGTSLPVDAPFMVLATQNPIEQEGTYALPEAQLDRFLMKINIDFPDADQESQIVQEVTAGTGSGRLDPSTLEPVCTIEDIIAAQQETADIDAVPSVVRYAVDIVQATREAAGLSLGAGTRGAISLVRAAKAMAVMEGRRFIIPADIKALALPVLRHRVAVAPQLAISGIGVDETLLSLIDTVEAPRE